MSNVLKTAVLMGILMAFCLWLGELMGGRQGLLMALLFGGLMNVFAYWFSDRLILWSSGAKPADEREIPLVYRVVHNLSHASRIPMPKIYIMETQMPNAFATGRNPSRAAVAVTRGILDLLDERELTGVLGHELSHVIHRDTLIATVASVMAGAIYVLARMAQYAMFFGGSRDHEDRRGANPLFLIATAILAPLAATLIQLAISRAREFHADEGGARLTGDPLALAGALQKIDRFSQRGFLGTGVSPTTAHLYIINPLSASTVLKLFSTHPPTEERVARLQAMMGHAKF